MAAIGKFHFRNRRPKLWPEKVSDQLPFETAALKPFDHSRIHGGKPLRKAAFCESGRRQNCNSRVADSERIEYSDGKELISIGQAHRQPQLAASVNGADNKHGICISGVNAICIIDRAGVAGIGVHYRNDQLD